MYYNSHNIIDNVCNSFLLINILLINIEISYDGSEVEELSSILFKRTLKLSKNSHNYSQESYVQSKRCDSLYKYDQNEQHKIAKNPL